MPAQPLNQLLKMAVVAGVETAVRLHIRRGDDMDACDGAGFTPLMLAASRNKANICRLLLEAGVNPNLVDHSGRNALAIALEAAASEAAAVIIEDANPRQVLAEDSVLPSVIDELATPDLSTDTIEPDIATGNDGGCLEKVEVSNREKMTLEYSDEEENCFDLSAWVEEEDGPPPAGDETLAVEATKLHLVITMRITMNSATHSIRKPATDSDPKPATCYDRSAPPCMACATNRTPSTAQTRLTVSKRGALSGRSAL